jgi:hypothetical protein
MLTTVSSSGHGETMARLLDAISQKGLMVFAQIDHAAAACRWLQRSEGSRRRLQPLDARHDPRCDVVVAPPLANDAAGKAAEPP